ncbi:hypothetical protein Q4E40_01025 [Pontibacter sp. BT731]|uniref:hypothetical protein n=1 Tax=Pontibacter coccineus TaxID=3063328 RepID=UPI0026E40E9A|nr:hypothetical protein [Pontibacter sp. BT731]MDO6388687.1 hypothetical protein [Pontibacter sp. BT731]
MIEIKLDTKPIPVPLIYKLVLLLAVLRYGTRKPFKAPLLSLHVFLWGIRSEENFDVLRSIARAGRDTIVPWSFEPSLDKTIILALVNEYCVREIVSNSLEIKLTGKGNQFLSKIEKLKVFEDDITKIKQIGIIPKVIIEKASKAWVLTKENV